MKGAAVYWLFSPTGARKSHCGDLRRACKEGEFVSLLPELHAILEAWGFAELYRTDM